MPPDADDTLKSPAGSSVPSADGRRRPGLLGLLVSLTRLIRLPQPSQGLPDERQQLIQRLEVRGTAADDVFRASAERIARPPRFAGELQDESVVRQEPAPPRSV